MQLGHRVSSPGLKTPLLANNTEAVVDYLYKDDCRARIKSDDREFVADLALHRGGQLLVSRDRKARTCTYQQGKAPRAKSKSGSLT